MKGIVQPLEFRCLTDIGLSTRNCQYDNPWLTPSQHCFKHLTVNSLRSKTNDRRQQQAIFDINTNVMEYITIQEAAIILNCSTRSVYRKLDKIDTFDNLVNKGFAKQELSGNGNSRRLFSKEWINSNFAKSVKPRQSKTSSLDVKAFDIFEKQLEIKDQQIDALQENLNLALHRVAEFEKYYHLNGMENSPKLTPTRGSFIQLPAEDLNITSNNKDIPEEIIQPEDQSIGNDDFIDVGDDKAFLEWVKSFKK